MPGLSIRHSDLQCLDGLLQFYVKLLRPNASTVSCLLTFAVDSRGWCVRLVGVVGFIGR